jgi:hypothetical protein
MWALVIFTFATTGAATATVATLEFSTQQLCLEAAREVENLTKPIISAGITRYEVAGTCVQTSEATKIQRQHQCLLSTPLVTDVGQERSFKASGKAS